MNSGLRIALVCSLSMLAMLAAGCVQRPATGPTKPPAPPLSPAAAAQYAAELANDECQRLYGRRPFVASQYRAFFQEGLYSWGYLDVGAQAGFSARVTFGRDGSHPRTEVYFSSDQLFPLR